MMGFAVLVHRQVLAHAAEMAEALQELKKQIRHIIRAIPPEPLRELRHVRIWLEWENNPHGAAGLATPLVFLHQQLMQPLRAFGR
jgi:hypothetical protein